MRIAGQLAVTFLLAVTAGWAQPPAIPDAETLYPPTPQRLAAVHAAAQRDGWAPQSAVVRAAAIRAYEHEKTAAAAAWLNAYRWTALLGESEAEFGSRWIDAVQAARVGHANMATRYEFRSRPLATALRPDLQAWLLGNAAFSAEFFGLLSPVDYVPRVFEILNELHERDPGRFKSHASLALAIAVVYDVPPPPFWPHGQVTSEALPRRLMAPADAFAWWTRQEQLGRLYHRPSRLGADELKFVVDAAAPPAELEWAQKACNLPLNELEHAYSMIRYRQERATKNIPVWPGKSYRLEDILATGGICADQAYFATEVGKARGVPTLLFYGAGNDGRHAWFGFLDSNQKWRLDAGRYAQQRFVTGYARDPQTWREFTDHELRFLSERFRALPSFRESRVHAAFAEEFLALGKAPAAAVAARKAVNYERRNQTGWETLLTAARREGRDARTLESIMREAALAFQLYPDLEADYVNRVAESLRARGETSAAEVEVRRIANKNRSGRDDLSVRQARDIVWRAMATQPLLEQIRAYNAVLDTYGIGGGIGFFDEIVVGFAEHLVQLQQRAEAIRAVERARRTLRVEPNGQLDREFARLLAEVKGGGKSEAPTKESR